MLGLRRLIREILVEDAYKKKTGSRYTGDIDAVRSTVNKDGYFLHFSDVPKIGVNPGSTFLPGTYFYPNIKPIFDAFFADVSVTARGQARGARYVYLVKLKPGLKILEGKDAIEAAGKESLRRIIQPILDADLNDWIATDGGADIKRNAGYFLSGVSPGIDHAYPSLEKLKEMGLLARIEEEEGKAAETIKALTGIRKSMNSKEAKSLAASGWSSFKPSFTAAVKQEGDLEPKRTKRTPAYQIYERGAERDPDGARKEFVKHIEMKMEDLKAAMSRSQLGTVTFEGMLKAGYIASSGGYEPFSAALTTVGTILRSTAMLKELAGLFLESPLQRSSKFFAMLTRMKKNPYSILLKGRGVVSSAELADKCLAAAEETLGAGGYRRFLTAVEKGDSVGINLILILGGEYDGVNDTTKLPAEAYEKIKAVGSKGASPFNAGELGVISRYESVQLFLKAPVGEKVEVVTMIDRFEGKPTDYLPGSHTPDAATDDETAPRATALKGRLFRGDQRRERWQEK